MLVTFKSTATGDVSMFGEVASTLLKMMGQSGEVPGAIVGEDVPAALETLKQNLEKSKNSISSGEDTEAAKRDQRASDDSDEEPVVSLATRANPLIKLLETAASSNAEVIWEH